MEFDWKTLPSLASLRAFELTARTGNFASAARELNVTHAAIAQRVRSLETDLGVSLVRRSGRNVVLTQAGARLATQLTDGFKTIATGVEDLRREESERPVRITTTVFFSQIVLLPKLEDFWRRHAGALVSVLPTHELLDIASLGMDLAIRASSVKPDWPGLYSEPLVASDLIVVGAPSMVNQDMPPLEDLPWIWTSGAKFEEDALDAFGLDFRKLKNADIGVQTYQYALARQGMGLTAAPEVLVREDLASGALCRVPVPSPLSITFYVVTPDRQVRPQAQEFIVWLKETLATEERIYA